MVPKHALVHETLNNLIFNSIKFTKTGCTVTLTGTGTKNQCAITVRDNGIGIPQTILTCIFDLIQGHLPQRKWRSGGHKFWQASC